MPAAHPAQAAGQRTAIRRPRLGALAWRNWPISWRLIAVVVIAVVLDMALGGLRLAATAKTRAEFGHVAQLAALGQQVTALAQALEDERDQTAGFIAAGRPASGLTTLQQAYSVTNAHAAQVRSLALGIGAAFPVSTRAKVTDVADRINDLTGLRAAALHTQLPSLPMIDDYSEAAGDLFTLNDEMAQGSDDSALADSVRTLSALSRMEDQASQQRAILYAAVIEQRFEPGALQELINAQSAQASDLGVFQASAALAAQQDFDNTVTGQLIDQARLLEQHAVELGDPSTTDLGLGPGAAPQQWYSAMSYTITRMRMVEARLAASIVAQSKALPAGPERSARLTGVLSGTILLLLLIAALVVARSLVLPLRRLQAGALEIATVSLPARVQQLGETPDPDVSLEVEPIGVQSTDEIGQVARAFDLVHQEAVRLAGNEALLRRNVSAMFVSLSRRSQSLIERLAHVLASVGQKERDPELLSELSTIDHLITRMRRNSENLLVLAGYEAVRRRRGSVPLIEVVEAAVSGIEQHGRVVQDVQPGLAVAGQVATDLVHLLAELVENAVSFSAHNTQVHVSGHGLASGGVLLDVSDGGVGVPAERLDEMNSRLDDPPVADVSVSRHMGLFAVSHLAARHGMRVRLCPSSPRGLTALVWLPDAITGQDPAAPGTNSSNAPWPGKTSVIAGADQAVPDSLRIAAYLREGFGGLSGYQWFTPDRSNPK